MRSLPLINIITRGTFVRADKPMFTHYQLKFIAYPRVCYWVVHSVGLENFMMTCTPDWVSCLS